MLIYKCDACGRTYEPYNDDYCKIGFYIDKHDNPSIKLDLCKECMKKIELIADPYIYLNKNK